MWTLVGEEVVYCEVDKRPFITSECCMNAVRRRRRVAWPWTLESRPCRMLTLVLKFVIYNLNSSKRRPYWLTTVFIPTVSRLSTFALTVYTTALKSVFSQRATVADSVAATVATTGVGLSDLCRRSHHSRKWNPHCPASRRDRHPS